MKNIIALDIGTSSMRAVVYGSDGTRVNESSKEYHTVFPRRSYVEQDPCTWLEAALFVLKNAAEYIAANSLETAGIAVTSQRSSLIPVDCAGTPLHNAIMWQDKRTLRECGELRERYGLSYIHKRTGLRINPFFVLPKIMWLRRSYPEICKAAYKFIGVQDFVVHYLTGRFVTDWTQASRTMLMNLDEFTWDGELMGIAGITAERLCELVPPGSRVGGLRRDVAALTGLQDGLPVVVSGGDQQNAAVGLGVRYPGWAEVNTGTGSFVISCADKPIFDDDCRVVCQASAIPGKWIVEAGIFNTGAIYRWFKEQFCPDIRDDKCAYELMNKEAATSGVGSSGVMLIPHFEGSAAPYWDPMSKGMFFNLSLGTRRADCMRAILEGIAMEIADNLRLIQTLVGKVEAVSLAGGMTSGDIFCSIQANVYGCAVRRFSNSEQSSLGAAIVSAPALGVYDDIDTAFDNMSSKDFESFEPNDADTARYQKLIDRKHKLYYALHNQGVFPEFMEI